MSKIIIRLTLLDSTTKLKDNKINFKYLCKVLLQAPKNSQNII